MSKMKKRNVKTMKGARWKGVVKSRGKRLGREIKALNWAVT